LTSTFFLHIALFFALAFPSSIVLAGQQFPPPGLNPSAALSPPSLNPQLALEEALKLQRASLEKQRQSIDTQLGETIVAAPSSPMIERFIVPSLVLSQPDCPPIDDGQLSKLVSSAAQKQSLDPALLRAVIKQESGFRPCAVSMKGAQGLMQLMPATARELHVANPFDPAQNIHAGAAYLKQMLGRYKGDLRLALTGYNAGPSRADQGDESIIPVETQNYVANILADLGWGQPETTETKEDLAPPDEIDNTEDASPLKPKP